jgi:methionyl-tRNA formyltransferase
MRILFAGTPEIAVKSLEKLASIHECTVLTAPDKISGRGKRVMASPVKLKAEELDLPVLQPDRLGSASRTAVMNYQPDLLAVFAYGKIFGPKFLSLFPKGGLNVHPSLLPKYRGPSPIPASILAGDTVTGVTVQRLSVGMDTGNVVLQKEIPLTGTETSSDLEKRSAELGADLLVEAAELLENGKAAEIPQDSAKATYCRIIKKKDGLIDWSLPAWYIERMVRAYSGWPGAYTFLDQKKLVVLSASVLPREEEGVKAGTITGIDKERGILVQTGDGMLAVDYLQLQSKKPMDFKSFVNGYRNLADSILGGNE